MLSETGRRVRLVVAAVVLGTLLAGTWIGNDDNFPFGPFRMYSTKNSLDGFVNAPEFVGITTDGTSLPISFSALGFRRAEAEGQVARMVANPELIGRLAVALEEADPSTPDLREVRLYMRVTDLEDGRPAGEVVNLLATWMNPSTP
jgi:hypothetical protein